MPYKMRTEGMEELGNMLRTMGESAESVASMALYDGAGIMADEIKKSAEGIKTAPFKYAGPGQTRQPSPEEKEVVLSANGMGISRFKKDGDGVETSVGYARAGYAELEGKTVPIPLIANAINSGTSFMQKQPFFQKAVNTGGKKATKAMTDKAEAELEKITKETNK